MGRSIGVIEHSRARSYGSKRREQPTSCMGMRMGQGKAHQDLRVLQAQLGTGIPPRPVSPFFSFPSFETCDLRAVLWLSLKPPIASVHSASTWPSYWLMYA